MEIKSYSVYGIPPLTPEEIIRRQYALFLYLEALIRAERTNPDNDYDGVWRVGLLKRIAMSDLVVEQRTTLTLLLFGNEPVEADGDEDVDDFEDEEGEE